MRFTTIIEIREWEREKFQFINENYREYIEEYSQEISPYTDGNIFNIKLIFDNSIRYTNFICQLTQHFPQQHYEIY